MLFDLTFLEKNKIFPPPTEWARLKSYEDNEKLFHQEASDVFQAQEERIRGIISKFAESDWAAYTGTQYEMDLNYFQLVALKNADMVCGEPPTVSYKTIQEDEAAEKAQADNLAALTDETDLFTKLSSIAIGTSYGGDVLARIYTDERGKNNFTIISPSMWFPIVDREIKERVLFHVLCWTECANPYADKLNRKYQLRVQIHGRGFYENRTYIAESVPMRDRTLSDGQNIRLQTFCIGDLVEKSPQIKTGLSDFAIIPFQNVVPPGDIFAINDFDRITPILAELNVRYTLENLILDKHSSPTLAVPPSALFQTRQGEWQAAVGGVIQLKPGEPVPAYITWDASLQANHTMIEKLEKHLYSLSEMGAVINDDSFGASQGFEALETRMTNARLKARRTSSGFTKPLKKLISLISERGYAFIPAEDLSVHWNDGLPNNEYRETDIASRKVGNKAVYDRSTILQEHFGKTKLEADAIVKKLEEEEHAGFAAQYSSLLGADGEDNEPLEE